MRGIRYPALGWRLRAALIIAIGVALASALLYPGTAFADPRPRWGDGLVVSDNGGGLFEMMQAIPDGKGNVIVVWSHSKWINKNMVTRAYVQKFDLEGRRPWGRPVLVVESSGLLSAHVFAVESSDGVILAWAERRGKNGSGVFAQRIDRNGKKQWGKDGVSISDRAGVQDVQHLIADGAGGAFVTWNDWDRPGLYIQRLAADGTQLWGKGGVPVNDLCGIRSDESWPFEDAAQLGDWVDIVSDKEGGLYLGWMDIAPLMTGDPEDMKAKADGHIFVMRVDADLRKLWPAVSEVDVRDVSVDLPTMPLLNVSDDGSVFLEWRQYDGDPRIVQKVGPDMTIADENPNSTVFTAKVLSDGRVIRDCIKPYALRADDKERMLQTYPIGDGLVCMMGERKAGNSDAMAFVPGGAENMVAIPTVLYRTTQMMRLDRDGKVTWSSPIAMDDADLLVPDDTGDLFLLSYKPLIDEMIPLGCSALTVQRFSPDGKPLWRDGGVRLIEGTLAQADIVPDGTGGFYVCWREGRPSKEPFTGKITPEMRVYDDLMSTSIHIQHIVDDGRGWADLPVKSWPFSYVNGLAKAKVVSGYSDGTFRPDRPVTRAEFVKMVVGALGISGDTTGKTSKLAVTDAGAHWASPYIKTAVVVGIANGYPDGAFRPDATISRAEAAAILHRAKELESARDVSQRFVDVPPGYWASERISRVGEAGIIAGYGDGTFRPSAGTTRAEAAKMVFAAMSLGGEK